MPRIMNGMSRGIRLQGTNVKIKLNPIGHSESTAEVDQEVIDDLMSNSVVRKYVEQRLVHISEGPLGQELPVKTVTAQREVPANLKPTEEKAKSGGTAVPEMKEAEVQEVNPPRKGKVKARGSAKAEKVEPARKAK